MATELSRLTTSLLDAGKTLPSQRNHSPRTLRRGLFGVGVTMPSRTSQSPLIARMHAFELCPKAGFSQAQVKAILKDGTWCNA